MRYINRKDGEGWSIRNRQVFKLACCDCGLVHNIAIHVPNKRSGALIGIAAERNSRATAAKRRADAAKDSQHLDSALRKLSMVLGNPCLTVGDDESFEGALIEVAIVRIVGNGQH